MSVEGYKMREVSATHMYPLKGALLYSFKKCAKVLNSKGLVERVLALIWYKYRHL